MAKITDRYCDFCSSVIRFGETHAATLEFVDGWRVKDDPICMNCVSVRYGAYKDIETSGKESCSCDAFRPPEKIISFYSYHYKSGSSVPLLFTKEFCYCFECKWQIEQVK